MPLKLPAQANSLKDSHRAASHDKVCSMPSTSVGSQEVAPSVCSHEKASSLRSRANFASNSAMARLNASVSARGRAQQAGVRAQHAHLHACCLRHAPSAHQHRSHLQKLSAGLKASICSLVGKEASAACSILATSPHLARTPLEFRHSSGLQGHCRENQPQYCSKNLPHGWEVACCKARHASHQHQRPRSASWCTVHGTISHVVLLDPTCRACLPCIALGHSLFVSCIECRRMCSGVITTQVWMQLLHQAAVSCFDDLPAAAPGNIQHVIWVIHSAAAKHCHCPLPSGRGTAKHVTRWRSSALQLRLPPG